jgi:hypothetical protein
MTRGGPGPRLFFAGAALLLSISAAASDHGFPRLMGMNIGSKHYDDPAYQRRLARLDLVILGFYRGWGPSAGDGPQAMRQAVRSLKRLNPDLLVGQYTLLNEASDDAGNTAERDKQAVLRKQGWWLETAAGRRVQWTARYGAWDINITDWTRPDENGERYPEWLARRDYRVFFEPVPEFDIWYFDNVMSHQRIAYADWKREGRDQPGTDAVVRQAFRNAQARHWDKARLLAPRLLLMGNADNDLSWPEYKGRLQAVFLEGMMGYAWSLHERQGWSALMRRYRDVFGNLAAPRIVGFNVAGRADDYRLLRFALSSCLMNDGYFSYTDLADVYGSVPWFDEYDIDLGRPLDPPQTVPWKNGIYRRRFAHGMVLVNPGPRSGSVAIEDGYARFRGKQAPRINDGRGLRWLTLAPRDGAVLIREGREGRR